MCFPIKLVFSAWVLIAAGVTVAASLISVASQSVFAADRVQVDLELVIAADASDSMDLEERWLQRQGFAAAFRDRAVIQAISSGPLGRIAVTYIEWADVGRPQVIVPWMLIDDAISAHSFARKLQTMRVIIMRKTSISGALLFSAHLIENSRFSSYRRVIDISGDGPNNQGFPVLQARDEVLSRGIVINGLPIRLKENNPNNPFGPRFDIKMLNTYFEDCVIGGPGAFIVSVKGRSELVAGIRRKLLLEIAGGQPKLIRAQFQQPRQPRLACDE